MPHFCTDVLMCRHSDNGLDICNLKVIFALSFPPEPRCVWLASSMWFVVYVWMGGGKRLFYGAFGFQLLVARSNFFAYIQPLPWGHPSAILHFSNRLSISSLISVQIHFYLRMDLVESCQILFHMASYNLKHE